MITVTGCKSAEIISYKERKYKEFLNYYLNTSIPARDIYTLINVNNTNSTGRYIRETLRRNGYSTDQRWQKIKKGEWKRNDKSKT